MKKFSLFCFLVLLCLCAAGGTPREKKRNTFDPRKPERQKYGRIRIRVRQETPRGSVSGRLPPKERIPGQAERFFNAINRLPESFIRRSGIRYVTFLDDLRLNGAPAGGVAGGDTIYLAMNCPETTVYHELFHIFDPKRKDKLWTRLNPRGFVYTGSAFYDADLSKFKRKRMNGNLEEKKYDADFVSRYAMSFEHEDRAETFSHMIVEGPKFLRRTEKSPVLKKKMEYIIGISGKRDLLGKDFWEKLFRPEKDAPPRRTAP